MKKSLILFILAVITMPSFGQKLDNQFYFRLGYSNPSWKQFGMEKNDWGQNISKAGVVFDMGSIFMIERWTAQNIALGINVDYLYINFADFSSNEGNYEDHLSTLRLGSKIGPSFTYSPTEKIAFDVYVKADIAWATASVWYVDEISEADDYYKKYGAVGISTGFNFRYNILMLGIEINSISPKLESDEYPGVYFGNNDNNSDKSPLPCVNFTIGVSF